MTVLARTGAHFSRCGAGKILPQAGNQAPAVPDQRQAMAAGSSSASDAVFKFTIPQGVKGDPGKDGTSVFLKGAVASFSLLPTTNRTVGDLWVTSDTGDGYVWGGTSWTNTGKMQGPAGAQATIAVGTVTGDRCSSSKKSTLGTFLLRSSSSQRSPQQPRSALHPTRFSCATPRSEPCSTGPGKDSPV